VPIARRRRGFPRVPARVTREGDNPRRAATAPVTRSPKDPRLAGKPSIFRVRHAENRGACRRRSPSAYQRVGDVRQVLIGSPSVCRKPPLLLTAQVFAGAGVRRCECCRFRNSRQKRASHLDPTYVIGGEPWQEYVVWLVVIRQFLETARTLDGLFLLPAPYPAK